MLRLTGILTGENTGIRVKAGVYEFMRAEW